jgi:hypothetical protein
MRYLLRLLAPYALCLCTHCHGLGCGGWCRWCP